MISHENIFSVLFWNLKAMILDVFKDFNKNLKSKPNFDEPIIYFVISNQERIGDRKDMTLMV